MNNTNQSPNMKSLRFIANEYTSSQINQCINEQISDQANKCNIDGETADVVNALARAGVIRELIDNGLSLTEATRELGRRMRSVAEMNE